MPKRFDEFLSDADNYVMRHIFALEYKTINDLFAEYERAYHRMQIQLEATARQYGAGETWSYADARSQQRTEVLVQQLMQEMRALTQRSADASLQAAMDSYEASYLGKGWSTDVASGGLASVPLLPAQAIRATILAPYQGSNFIERFKGHDDEFQARIRRAMVQSQIEGESIYQAQRRLANELGIDIGRRGAAAKQANQGRFNRTQMIARTEILRASNMGAVAIYEQNSDILRGWTWTAAHDDRVCPICADLDGKTYEFGKHAPPPAHVSCRCSAIPAFINQAKQKYLDAVPTFKEWAAGRGISQNVFGKVYDLRARKAPKSKVA